ncbi:hypothetical protein ACE6H2_012161 [Prunus campanulata]
MEHRCKLCNKTFSSGKVLGGHMRGHGTKNSAKAEKKLKVSNVDFEGDDDEHAGYGLRVNPKKSWKFSGSKVQASEKESLCKVCGKSSVTESSDNNSLSLEVQSPVQKNRIMGNRGGISGCNDTGNKIFEFGENDSGFASDEGKTGKLEVSIDRFYRGTECKRPKLDEDSAFVGYDAEIEKESHGEMEAIPTEVTELEMDVDIIEEEELDVTKLGSMKSGMKACDSGNNMLYGTESEIFADSRKKREHKCRTCKKLFRSHQALGGHQRVHKATNNCSGEKIEDCEDKIQINKLSKIEYSSKLAKLECTDNSEEQEMERVTVTGFESKVHRCTICLKVFATGQALGGHKRVHFGKDSETGTEHTRALNQQISEIRDAFELSQPVKLEEENGDVEFKSWWLGNEHKLELLVGLMSN